MRKYLEFINEKLNTESEFGCLMVYFDNKGWEKYISEVVKEEDLYKPDDEDFGYCKYNHTTVLFGFHDYPKIEKDIKDYLIPIKELNDIKIKDISIFENDDYDVVKIDIESNKLTKLNKILRKKFEYTNDYNDYTPHITIAYVKSGEGKKYVQKRKSEVLKPEKYVYSDPKYKKITIKI